MKNWICVVALLRCCFQPVRLHRLAGRILLNIQNFFWKLRKPLGGGDQCFGDSAETSGAHQGHCYVSQSSEVGYDRLGPRRKRGGDRSIPKDRKMESAGFYQIPAGQLGNSGRDLESRTGAFGGDQQGTQTIIQDAI